jgi:predicted ester cyclase
MSDQENIKIAQSFFDAWNKGNLELFTPYQAPDVKAETAGMAGHLTGDQNMAYNQVFFKAFPGSKFEFIHTIVQNDYAVVNWRFTGTQSGPLQMPMGTIPPTGKKVKLIGSTTVQIKNNKIVYIWNYFDLVSLLSQVGVMPSSVSAQRV